MNHYKDRPMQFSKDYLFLASNIRTLNFFNQSI